MSAAGAIASAGTVAATILCCLPFATGVVGASVAVVGARFEPVRPYLIAISAACVAYALFETYRPGARRCGPDGCVNAGPSVGRQVFVWALTIAVALMLTTSWWVNEVIYWML
jgi:hypothetical protein